MKYIKTFQSGGLIAYAPGLSNSTGQLGASSGASADSGKKSVLDDQIMKELITKGGLTNDTNALVKQLIDLEKTSVNPYLSSGTRTQSLALIGKVRELQQSKELWTHAYKTSKSSGGLGEIAVGDQGELYVKDETGRVKAMTVQAYKKNAGKVQTLTVSELLNEREKNPLLIGQNNIFDVANNSIGVSKITDYARKIISSLGTESQTSEKIYDKEVAMGVMRQLQEEIGAGRVPTAEERKGFAVLDAIAGSPARYNEVKQKSSSQKNHAMKAVNYIWSTLESGAKNKLSAQAALNNQEPTQLLLDLVLMSTDQSEETSLKPISEGKAKTGQETGESLAGGKHMNNPQMMIHGTLATGKEFQFNDPEASTKFSGLILGTSALTTPDGKSLPPTTLRTVMNSGWEQVIDTNNVFFGNRKVPSAQFSEIVVDGASDMGNVYLPVDPETGGPDNNSLQIFRQLMDHYNSVKDNPDVSDKDLEVMFNNSGFKVTINPDKTLDVRAAGGNVKPFFITWAYTNDATNLIKENDDAKRGGLTKLTSDEHHAMVPVTNAAWTTRNPDGSINNIRPNKTFLREHIYKGLIAVPLREGATVRIDGMLNAGPKQGVYSEKETKYMAQNSSGKPFVSSDMSLLNDN